MEKKSKIKRLVVAINKRYPEILDILEVENLKENQIELTKLSEIVRIVFKWTSNLSYLTITNNPILSKGFDLLQDANRKAKNKYQRPTRGKYFTWCCWCYLWYAKRTYKNCRWR